MEKPHPLKPMKEKYAFRHMFPFIGIVLAVLVAMLWPLLKPGYFVTDDGEWMVIRLSAFYQSLASGQFPVRYLGRLNYSYGYPVANFLYPGFLYLGSVLHVLGLSFVDAVKMICIGSVVGGAVFLYFSLRRRFSHLSAFFGTFSFITAPYLLYDMYVRGSVGEVLGLFAATVCLFSIVLEVPWLLAPSFAFLIISHNTIALLTGFGLLLFALVSKRRQKLLTGIFLGIGMASFFWLPALIEKNLVRFDHTVISNPNTYLITLSTAPLLGFAFIIALGLLLGFRKKTIPQDTIAFVITSVALMLSLRLSSPVWNISFFARLVQFPYRFLILIGLFGPWLVAFALDAVKGWKKYALMGIFVVLFFIGSVPIISSVQYVSRPLGFYTTNEGSTTVANEYMPGWISEFPTKRPVETLEVLDGDATLSIRTFTGERLEVAIDAKEDTLMQINKIYYPGWGVTIDNTLVPVNYHNAMGVMRIIVPSGHHTVRAAFRETPFRFITDLISLVSGILWVIVLWQWKKRT